jgi:Na+-translocating ferredoxin:NAD+ oxidoreductase RnfC subunit
MTESLDRSQINGVKVIARQPANFKGHNVQTQEPMNYTVDQIDECLLEDGTTIFQCNSKNEPCNYVNENPISVRSHLRAHSDRIMAKKAQEEAAEALRRAQEAQRELEESRTRKSNGAKRGWENRKAAGTDGAKGGPRIDTPKQLASMRAAGVVGLIETIADGVNEINRMALQASLLLTQVKADVEALQTAEPTPVDPAILEKAAKYDQFKSLMQ